MLWELQSRGSCACHTWELIKSCCFTQNQLLEGNRHLAGEEEAALGAGGSRERVQGPLMGVCV